MDERLYKQTIQKAFDEAASGYDLEAMRFFDNSAKHLVGLLALEGNEHVLDVAAGTGKIAAELAARLSSGNVTALDLSDGMLRRARMRAEKEGLRNIAFECLDVDQCDFPQNYFDGMTCGFGAHFWSDMKKSLRRIQAFLKPGAFTAITSFAVGSFEPLSNLTLKRFAAYGVKMPDSYTWERLGETHLCVQLLKDAGLKEIRSERRQVGYALKEPDQWWDLVRFTGFRSFLNQVPAHLVERFKKENLEEIWQLETAEGVRLDVEVIFTVGRKP